MKKRLKRKRKTLIKRKLHDLKLPPALPGVGAAIPVTVMPDNVLGLTTINLEAMKALGIVLRGGRSRAETHETLLHEILHCVETEARRQGVLKDALPERVIEFFAGGLLILLAGSGLYQGVSQKEAMDYIKARAEDREGWDGQLEPED